VIGSGAVSDSTRSLQAARDEINLGNSMPRIQSPHLLRSINNGENEEKRSEDGEKLKKEVKVYLHRKNNGKQAITLPLLDVQLAGAQQLDINEDCLEDRITWVSYTG